MPLPAKLKYSDRIAPHSTGYYFLCHRAGHPKVSKRFTHASDAKEFRAAHDTAYHNVTFRQLGLEPRRDGRIDQIMSGWLTHIRALEVEGVRAPETTAHYELCVQHLSGACPAAGIRTAYDITPERISTVVRWFRQWTATEGALTVKALSALKTMIRWKGLAADWKIPHDEIRAQKRQKKEIDAGTIRQLIAAMPHGSIEEAVATLKARTGARDVEIFCARKEEFDLDLHIEVDSRSVAIGVFRPILRNKRSSTTSAKRHVYVLTSDAVDRVRPFVARAAAGAYVFTTSTGQHVTRESMRAPIRAAAKKAGFVMQKHNAEANAAGDAKVVTIGSIDTIAQIRSEVVTIVKEETSLQGASDHIGHQDTRTTDRWYVKDRLTLRKLAEKYRPAEIIARAIPLQDPSVN